MERVLIADLNFGADEVGVNGFLRTCGLQKKMPTRVRHVLLPSIEMVARFRSVIPCG